MMFWRRKRRRSRMFVVQLYGQRLFQFPSFKEAQAAAVALAGREMGREFSVWREGRQITAYKATRGFE